MPHIAPSGLEDLQAKLGKKLPDGITVEVTVAYKVTNPDFGELCCETQEDAVAVKAKCDEASRILHMLPRAVDPRGAFSSGGGYIQHPYQAIELFVGAVRDFIAKHYDPPQGESIKRATLATFDNNPRSLGLLSAFSEADLVLSKVYERLCRIDDQNREWGQVGYAMKSYPHWVTRTEEAWTNTSF